MNRIDRLGELEEKIRYLEAEGDVVHEAGLLKISESQKKRLFSGIRTGIAESD